jgi:sulfate/thiosulfate-binding protein
MRTIYREVLLATVALVLMLGVILMAEGCQPIEQSSQASTRQTIVVYGFSIEEEVITEGIFPAFQTYWREQTGQEISFRSVFTGSEQISEAIIEGASADVAILSNEQHAVWLHINDLVETDWHTFPNDGIVSQSPLVIVVRPGNPLGIGDWTDLARPGVRLVHCDPRTSGGGQWALLAEYGSVSLDEENGSAEAAQEQLRDIWTRVVALPPSCQDALREFLFGTGDVLVAYEQNALLAQARGATLEIVVPRHTIMSEHIAVIVDKNVKPWEREVVEAFVAFLWSEEAQEIFTRYYFRAVTDEALNEAVPEFHKIEQPFTVEDLGGWGRAYPEIIQWLLEEAVTG